MFKVYKILLLPPIRLETFTELQKIPLKAVMVHSFRMREKWSGVGGRGTEFHGISQNVNPKIPFELPMSNVSIFDSHFIY
jgi:hypothetical protein